MKRIICFFLVACLLLTGFTVSAEERKEELPYYVDAVMKFGLMDLDNSTDFLGSESVSRGKAVGYILKLMNVEPGDFKNPFNDVSKYGLYYKEITTAYELGIIKGDENGNFNQDEKITTYEAAVMMLRAMGYSVMAEGNSLNTYQSLAVSKGFLKGVEDNGGYITRLGFAKMLYNTFDIGIFEQNKFGEQEAYVINNDKTSLYFHGMLKDEGVVSANSISSIYYSAQPSKPDSVRINTKEYRIKDKEYENLLGYNVEYYFYDEAHSDEAEIFYMVKKDNIEETRILEEDCYETDGEGLKYTDKQGKTEKISVNNKTVMILNGFAIPYDLNYITKGGNTGSFTLIKQKGSSFFNAIIINSYRNDIVAAVDLEKGYVYLKYSLFNKKSYIELPIDKEDGKIIISKNNEPADLKSICVGDVISYSVDLSGNRVCINLSDKSVTGKLVSENKEDKELCIDNEIYNKASDFPLYSQNCKIGEQVTAYLNFEGKIFDMSASVSKNYAYVLKTGFTKDPVEKKGILKLFTSKSVAENVELAERVTIDNGEYTEVGSEYIKHESVISLVNSHKKELIAYDLDNEGKIKNISFSKAPSADEFADKDKFILSNTKTVNDVYSGVTIDGIICDKSIVFSIPDEAEPDEKDCSASIGNLTRSRNYAKTEIIKFYDVGFNGVAGATLIMQPATNEFRNNPTSVCVVKKITDSVRKDQTACKKLYYLSNGVEASVNVASEIKSVTLKDCPALSFDMLSCGDVICFETDSYGELERFSVIYDCSEAVDDKIIITNGNGVGCNIELCVIKGILRYMDNSMLTVQFNKNGKTAFEPMYYNDGATAVVVNSKKGTVRYENIGRLIPTNFSSGIDGDKIIVAGNRNALTEVLIYE